MDIWFHTLIFVKWRKSFQSHKSQVLDILRTQKLQQFADLIILIITTSDDVIFFIRGQSDECSNRITFDWLERLESREGLKAPIREYTSASEQAPHDK